MRKCSGTIKLDSGCEIIYDGYSEGGRSRPVKTCPVCGNHIRISQAHARRLELSNGTGICCHCIQKPRGMVERNGVSLTYDGTRTPGGQHYPLVRCSSCGATRRIAHNNTLRRGFTGVCLACTLKKRGMDSRRSDDEVLKHGIAHWGDRDPARRRYIRVTCGDCGKDRYAHIQRGATGLCSSCASKRYNVRLTGPDSGNWKGGKSITRSGYVRVNINGLPEQERMLAVLMSSGNEVMEHRLIIALGLGRPLRSDEVVHHLNGVKDDNRPENLELATRRGHGITHQEALEEIHRLRQLLDSQ